MHISEEAALRQGLGVMVVGMLPAEPQMLQPRPGPRVGTSNRCNKAVRALCRLLGTMTVDVVMKQGPGRSLKELYGRKIKGVFTSVVLRLECTSESLRAVGRPCENSF